MPKLYHHIRKPIKLLECKGFISALLFLLLLPRLIALGDYLPKGCLRRKRPNTCLPLIIDWRLALLRKCIWHSIHLWKIGLDFFRV